MANGKAQITDIDLSNVSVNLTDYLSDITPYEGFVQCNSPWIGGLLNNVYKSKLNIPEGHKLVRVNRGNVYTIKSEGNNQTGLYKNGNLIHTLSSNTVEKTEWEGDQYVVLNSPTSITIKWGNVNQTYNFKFEVYYDFVLDEDGERIHVSVHPYNISSFSELAYCKAFECYKNGTIREYTGLTFPIFLNGRFVTHESGRTMSLAEFINKVGGDVYNFNSFSWDSAGVVFQGHKKDASPEQMVFARLWLNRDNTWSWYKIDNICVNPETGIWDRGVKIPTYTDFDTLYYGNYVSGISINNSVITYDVDKIFRVDSVGNYITYADPSGKKWKLKVKNNNLVTFTADDDFIYFDTTDYNNTFDLKSEEMFCRSDDYNDRLVMKLADNTSSTDTGLYVTGWHSNVTVQNYKNFATVYAQKYIQLGNVSFVCIDWETEKHTIDVYLPTEDGGVAKYLKTLYFNTDGENPIQSIDPLQVGTSYEINSSYNQLYNTPLLMDIKSTYINEKVGSIGDYSYILAKSQRQETICGYYAYTLSEISDVFLTQGTFYGVSDKYIFNLSVQDSTLTINGVVLNKLDLKFLGAFPTMALFWSQLDKSLYSFTGDANLTKSKEAYRINAIYKTYCDPSRLTMIIATDIGVLIIYQNQVILLEDLILEDGEIYYDSNSYILGNTLMSLSYKEGFDPQPVKLHTEFYGVNGGVKSVNDTVYIRLAKGHTDKGYIKITSYVLNDKSFESPTKEEKIIEWDKITESKLIRYQPKAQSGLGFSVKIETSNPIVSLSVGHTPEAIVNTNLNL